MKFVCDRCQTRYSIADEKVRQKILRIRCKTCGNVIIVQDEQRRGSGTAEPHSHESAQPASGGGPKPVPSSGPKAAPSSGPKAAPLSGPKAAPSSGPKPPPPPPARAGKGADPLGGHVEWYIAVDGERSGPFSRVEVARRIHAAGLGKTVHVWKEGMSGWKLPDEVSVVARELNLLRPVPPLAPREPLPAARATPVSKSVVPPASAKPGPSAPPPGVRPGVADFEAVETTASDPHGFRESTTKKSKQVRDLVTGLAGDEFGEAATRNSKDGREVAAASPGVGFSEVTTKKGKNLGDLEAETPTTPGVDTGESGKTPPPMRPLPPIGSKVTAPVPASPRVPAVPLPAPVVTFDAQAVAPGARPFPSFANPSTPLAKSSTPFVMPGTPLAAPSAPFARPGTPFAAVPSATPAPFALPAAAPGSLPLSGGLPTPFPVSVAPFGTAMSSSMSADIKLSHGGIAGLFQRQPGLKYVVAVLAIVALIILLGMVILRGESQTRSEPAAPAEAEPPKAAEPKLAAAESPAPPPAQEKPAPVTSPSAPSRGKSFSGKSVHHRSHAPERPAKEKAPAPPPRLTGARPNPFDEAKSVSQSQITAVVRNPANQAALKSCYERALKMDNHLTSGRIDVTVSIGMSGAVQRVVINAPSSFILVEPCIKGAVKRWVFPASTEEYATNFPLIMQGGM
jgi:predicted Zn finger-like uncharacterized protein